MTFGEKLRELRTMNGMSQETLAKELGVTRRTIIAYENGATYPRYRSFYDKLAEIFHVQVDYLRTENEAFMEQVGQMYGRRGQLQARDILEQTAQLFAGGELSDDDQIAFINEMQQLYLDSKIRARKFTPKKFLNRTGSTKGKKGNGNGGKQ